MFKKLCLHKTLFSALIGPLPDHVARSARFTHFEQRGSRNTVFRFQKVKIMKSYEILHGFCEFLREISFFVVGNHQRRRSLQRL